ncbi:hypothetical protein IM700_005295 [Paenibacillus sp. DXFW5]|uniref:Catalase immune-responsive domain-containing protein n=1 Tax=Paenibacillus rhizolycopersici TaxID=2780073 RepID=A0ABS2H138_9BACL|nr:hypothetical protein [Paenibacillus rhizolycopersici]
MCSSVIQETWISHFTQADPEYGRRVKEGLEAVKREMDAAGKHTSTASADEALDKAQGMGHKSDRY